MPGYYDLISILREGSDPSLTEDATPVQSCPNDGTTLQEGPRGVKFCPYDGWRESDGGKGRDGLS